MCSCFSLLWGGVTLPLPPLSFTFIFEFLIVAQQDLKIQKPVSVRSELSLFSTFSIAFTRERQHVRVLNYSRTVSAIVFRPPS